MDDSRWERYAAIGGLVFVVLSVLSVLIPGSPPSIDDPSEIADYFADNDSAIQVAAFLTGLSAVAILWWFGSLWRRLVQAEGGRPRLAIVSGLGLVLSGSLALASSVVSSTVAMRRDVTGDDGMQFFYTLSWTLLAIGSFAVATHVGAASAVILRTRALPVWLGWLGALDALVWIVGGGGAANDSDFFLIVSLIAFFGWMVWIVGVSLALWGRVERVVTEVDVVVVAEG